MHPLFGFESGTNFGQIQIQAQNQKLNKFIVCPKYSNV